MFWRKKNNKSDVICFLEKADDAYIDAFQYDDIRLFQEYATVKVLREIDDMLKSKNQISFGLKKYRHREWKLVKEGDVFKVYFKNITHDNLELSHKVSVSLADDISEIWTIEPNNKTYIVTDIQGR